MKESYQFTTMQELRDFLNQFNETDLSTIYPECNNNCLTIEYSESTLTDGSKVINMVFK